MNIKQYFASANTGVGFTNFFEHINGKNKGFQYIIKGGAGTGKSTLMKKVAEHFLKNNFCLEKFYCSSDKNSLDGIRICEKNISIVDGTAPHITEATLLGIHQKIVDVGKFISDDIRADKKEIIFHKKNKQLFFEMLYKDLNCLNTLCFENYYLLKRDLPLRELEKKASNIIKYFLLSQRKELGTQRKLFQESFGENSIFTFENTNNFNNVFEIELDDFEKNKLFPLLAKQIINKGYDIISFHSTIYPKIINSIYIPENNLFLRATKTQIKNVEMLKNNQKLLEKYEKNQKLIEILIKNANQDLLNAKNEHMQIEKFYIKNMNFKKVDALTNTLIKEITNFN